MTATNKPSNRWGPGVAPRRIIGTGESHQDKVNLTFAEGAPLQVPIDKTIALISALTKRRHTSMAILNYFGHMYASTW